MEHEQAEKLAFFEEQKTNIAPLRNSNYEDFAMAHNDDKNYNIPIAYEDYSEITPGLQKGYEENKN